MANPGAWMASVTCATSAAWCGGTRTTGRSETCPRPAAADRSSPPVPPRRCTGVTTGFGSEVSTSASSATWRTWISAFACNWPVGRVTTSPGRWCITGIGSSGVGSDFAVYHGHRNLEWLFLKNMPGPLLWRYLPLHLVTWPLLLLWFTARGRGSSFVRAKWDAVRGIPKPGAPRHGARAASAHARGDRRATRSHLALEEAGWGSRRTATGNRQPKSSLLPVAWPLAVCLFYGFTRSTPSMAS